MVENAVTTRNETATAQKPARRDRRGRLRVDARTAGVVIAWSSSIVCLLGGGLRVHRDSSARGKVFAQAFVCEADGGGAVAYG